MMPSHSHMRLFRQLLFVLGAAVLPGCADGEPESSAPAVLREIQTRAGDVERVNPWHGAALKPPATQDVRPVAWSVESAQDAARVANSDRPSIPPGARERGPTERPKPKDGHSGGAIRRLPPVEPDTDPDENRVEIPTRIQPPPRDAAGSADRDHDAALRSAPAIVPPRNVDARPEPADAPSDRPGPSAAAPPTVRRLPPVTEARPAESTPAPSAPVDEAEPSDIPPLEPPDLSRPGAAPSGLAATSQEDRAVDNPRRTPAMAPRASADMSGRAKPAMPHRTTADMSGRAKSAVPPRAAPEVSQRAKSAVENGIRLAEKRAYYSARAELIHALRVIAQALDTQSQQQIHSQALAAGLRALREARDFVPPGSNNAFVDVGLHLPAHRTPVLKSADPRSVTPLVALQRYYAYAQQQFAIAAGRDPVASEALFALGKLSLLIHQGETESLGGPTAIALYQAALMVDRNNASAANELGVLLAKYGRLDDARRALQQSVSVRPTPEAWQNLAAVHRRLGENALASRAERESLIARGIDPYSQAVVERPKSPTAPFVQWVEPEQFMSPAPGSLRSEQLWATPRTKPSVTSATKPRPTPTRPTTATVAAKKPGWPDLSRFWPGRSKK